jgi:hypothetical protein
MSGPDFDEPKAWILLCLSVQLQIVIAFLHLGGGTGSRPPTLSVWASRHLLKFIDFSDNTVSYHE